MLQIPIRIAPRYPGLSIVTGSSVLINTFPVKIEALLRAIRNQNMFRGDGQAGPLLVAGCNIFAERQVSLSCGILES
jgi:hypothetical protein